MGHKIEKQKQALKSIFVRMLETNIEIMKFQLTLTENEDEIKGIKKLIKDTEKAIQVVGSVSHYEILVSLYNTFVNGKESYFIALCKTINRKDTIKKWDRTQKGFELFLKLESEAKAKSKEEYEKKLAEKEMIEKAKKEGKKVEMILVDGKLKPHIVEENIA